MTYEEIRQHVQEHFRELLSQFKDQVRLDGPPDLRRLDALRASESLAGGDPETWVGMQPGGADGLLRGFCARRGIPEADLSELDRSRLLQALQDGHGSLASSALNHVSSLAHFDLEPPAVTSAQAGSQQDAAGQASTEPHTPFAEVVRKYFVDADKADKLAARTRSSRLEALELLAEITGDKPPAELTKADARAVKDALMSYPKNRNKMPATKGKPLSEVMQIQGLETIAAKTVNAYLSHMQVFLGWATDNGYSESNVLAGMSVPQGKRSLEERRDPFSPEQLRTMFLHLTENPAGLVRKDMHKWGTLISMFSGMRLGEVAQLEVGDIKQEGVWLFDFIETDDKDKVLKTAASRRRVPVHDRLIQCGLLQYVEAQRELGERRLFPDLTYSAGNGWGRNLGRWFNERFLVELGIKTPRLVFHSFRHTMNTRLLQAGASDKHIAAIIGHAQSGMTYATYFREGFLPPQLKATLDQFDF
jgi:integrase